jgi:hypothetical protein
MAQLAADFTNDQARFDEVVFQRGKVVIDGELNDGQRIQRIATKRLKVLDRLQANTLNDNEMIDAPMFGSGMKILTAEDGGGIGPDQVKLVANWKPTDHKTTFVEFRGYVFEMTEELTFDVAAAGGSVQTQQLYMTLEESEVGPALDPSIQVDAVGETTVRVKVTVTFKLGAVDTAAAEADNTVAEPWESGVAAGVIAEIVRDVGDVSTTRRNVRYRYRMTPELVRRNLQFLNNGMASLRPSIHSREAADAFVQRKSGDPDTLKINRLAVLVGAHAQNDTKESMSVYIDIDVLMSDFEFGDCLVIVMPNNPAGSPARAGDVSLDEYVGVYDNTPGEGEVLIRIERFSDWGGNQNFNRNPTKNLDDRFVLCANLTNPANSVDGELPLDIMFCDGQRITQYRDLDVVVAALAEDFRISWGYGQLVLTKPSHPNPLTTNPTTQNNVDETPYVVGQAQPVSSYFKHLFSQKLVFIGGIPVFMRYYAFNELPMDVPGTNGASPSGFCMTTNAVWDAGSETWSRDVDNQHSTIYYFGGVTVSASIPAEDAPGSFIGQAMHGAAEVDTWAQNGWILPGRTQTESAHVIWTSRGALKSRSEFLAKIEDYHSIEFTGAEAFPADNDSNRLYARNVPKAYATLRRTVGGVVEVESDHFFNVQTVNVVDASPSPSYIDVVLDVPMTSASFTATANLQFWSGDQTDPANMLVIYRVQCTSANKVRIYAYDHANSSWLTGINTQSWEISLIVFGKQA